MPTKLFVGNLSYATTEAELREAFSQQGRNVRSVRIAMVFSSNDSVASALDTKTYTVLNTTYDPVDDRRLRRVYTTTVTLRNRVQ